MRDLLFTAIIFVSIPYILKRPWIGIMMWTWLSVMSPHRLTWGFAYNQSWAALIACVTLISVLWNRDEKHFPVTPITVLLILMPIWWSVTTVFAIEPDEAWFQWKKVSKIFLMLLVTLYVLNTRKHIEWLIWITLGSVAFYGVKGGWFTVRTGGGERVWGPAGSFIEDNNALALAIVMCIPLLNYVRMTVKRRWVSPLMLLFMVLCAFSAIGSHSRGALLGICAMGMLLWWRGKSKVLGLIAIGCTAVALLAFAPEKWTERMNTIDDYETDGSSQGRLNAWAMALNLVKDRPIVGGGFELYGSAAFARWAPNPTNVHSSHSIYFQILGEHGFPALFMYLALGILTWKLASWIRTRARGHPDFEWAYWYASMCQVSLVGFAVGGAFQNLAYWDVPYNLIIALVLTRVLMERALVPAKAPGPLRDADGRLIREPTRPEAVPALRQ